jgi:hypothetical protein
LAGFRHRTAGLWHTGWNLPEPPESGLTKFRRRWPDSSDIDRMLSDFGTGKISVMVDYLK